ncbi:MAG: hypothetical protein FH753_17845 [Firmicutes bacterium]|nr:hypothetical protein [Bacillota bacterium]
MIVLTGGDNCFNFNIIIENSHYLDVYLEINRNNEHERFQQKYEITNGEIDINYIKKLYKELELIEY